MSVTLIEDNAGTLTDKLGFVATSRNDYVLLDVYVVNDVRYNLYRPKGIRLRRLSKQQKFREFISNIVNERLNSPTPQYNPRHHTLDVRIVE